MQLICPCCHNRYPLDAANQDEAARDLLALRGTMPPRLWQPVIAYLGLFRSESRALSWDKALKLAKEAMELGANGEWDRLETALCETVEALRLKGGKPLKNHNYLKAVLANSPSPQPSPMKGEGAFSSPALHGRGAGGGSKRLQALKALAAWGASDWLRSDIANGLSALLASPLKNAPAAETITLAADVWHLALKKICTIEEIDAARIRAGFERLFPKVTEWPAVKQLIAELPSRPHREALPLPKPSDEEYERGASTLRNFRESLT